MNLEKNEMFSEKQTATAFSDENLMTPYTQHQLPVMWAEAQAFAKFPADNYFHFCKSNKH